ncbi:hypothetical protein K461DRAFT_281014 [Myriangium duriaei CBS 260.36]|uniref:Peptidase metallopeptidase domain-containing protein n=1 Tax=Myriangium duriaei CBS 260.36 TaxID=1168546 RepID=A0A9P4ITN2_9PEZI|nr:hypothetical protein K461DRAFT_281014 [Myriangium duriaei CBS 260.36]
MAQLSTEVFGKGKNATLKSGVKCPELSEKLMIGNNGYSCKTQEATQAAAGNSGPDKIMLGWKHEVPRWKKPTKLKWAVYYNGWGADGQAAYAANKLNDAAKQWNALDLGVTFEWVDSIDDSTFALQYRKAAGSTLAEAFFPNEDMTNTVTVYQSAFDPRNIGSMDAIFLHELGHVLGLRHEFAQIEGDFVPFGARNPKSVMSYNFPPAMQDSDKVDTQGFYAFTGTSIDTYNISDKTPYTAA